MKNDMTCMRTFRNDVCANVARVRHGSSLTAEPSRPERERIDVDAVAYCKVYDVRSHMYMSIVTSVHVYVVVTVCKI